MKNFYELSLRKIRILSLVMLSLIFSNFSYASIAQLQDITINLPTNGITFKELVTCIESQSNFLVMYNTKEIDENKRVTFESKSDDINSLLEQLSRQEGVNYALENNYIIISKRAKASASSSTQQTSVSGVVIDDQNNPMVGVIVSIEGTNRGVMTVTDGQYTINVKEGDVLNFEYAGLESQSVKIGKQSIVNVTLKANDLEIDEVVVVGYGTVKKSNLTGAVVSVKMDDIPKQGTSSVSNVLVGRVPGLSIRQSSASPDAGYDMVIRGAASTGAGNTPLYVIDGFPGGSISTINPNDIESVEVLKDASATSIYGARAANGVILITTKKGKKGELSVNFRTNLSSQVMANPYEAVSSKDYMNLSNSFFYEEWLYNNNMSPYGSVDPSTVTSTATQPFTAEQIANAQDVTDWYDEVTRTGFINEESLSVTGGAENVRYLFSLTHYGQEGVVINSGLEKYMGRTNLEMDLAKFITTGVSISANQSITDYAAQASSASGSGIIKDALMYPQYLSIYDDEGNYVINPEHTTVANPVSWKDVENRDNSFSTLINNFWLFKITDNLDFRTSWGVNSSFTKNSTYYPKSHLVGSNYNSYGSITETRKNDYLLDATLTYKKELFSGHNLTAMAGYAYQKFNTEMLYGSNSDFITDLFGTNNLGAGGDLTKSVSSSKSITKYLSYFGRINYDIKDKYLFTFTMRVDGSDKFGTNNKYGYFPSGAFAWKITDEDFMQNQSTISNLKLRLSAGQTGNASIGGNAYGYYVTGADYVFGNTLTTGVSENQLANPYLKWETTTEYNVGIDFGLFKNRLTGTIEYYYKQVSNLLDSRDVGSYYPVSSVADNLGTTQSRGFEFMINSVNIDTPDFRWTTNLNLFNYKDSWKERNPYSILSIYENATDPLHVSYGYVSDGLIQEGEVVDYMPGATAGSIKVKDLNGWLKDSDGNYILSSSGEKQLSGSPDGTIDDADKTIIYNQAPSLSFGISNDFRYKNFDLSLFFYGEVGRELYNSTLESKLDPDNYRFGDNVTVEAFDIWSSTNKDGIYPNGLYSVYQSSTDFWIERADFIRLKDVTLGYTLPSTACSGIFKNARFFVSAQNLFVITNYSGSDPETDTFTSYPNQRTFSLGIDLTF